MTRKKKQKQKQDRRFKRSTTKKKRLEDRCNGNCAAAGNDVVDGNDKGKQYTRMTQFPFTDRF